MRASLIINGFDVGPYIAEDGLEFDTISRNQKSVTVKSGDLYQSEREKTKITVKLLDMSDEQYAELIQYRTYLSNVSFVDFVTGQSMSNVLFYFYKPKITARKCIGTLTYLTDLTLELEQK